MDGIWLVQRELQAKVPRSSPPCRSRAWRFRSRARAAGASTLRPVFGIRREMHTDGRKQQLVGAIDDVVERLRLRKKDLRLGEQLFTARELGRIRGDHRSRALTRAHQPF